MKYLVTVSRNFKKDAYNQIQNLFKKQVILRRGKKSIEQLINYATFKGFNKILVLDNTKDKNTIRINTIKIKLNDPNNNFKWHYKYYDLNENKKLYIKDKNTKNK